MSAARVLVVGAGGLGAPVLRILARSVDVAITLVDDDVIDETNLHRQILFDEADVGRKKTDVAAERVRALADGAGRRVTVETIDGRLVPDVALAMVRGHHLVVEGADNLPTKFLAADAAHLADVPIVHAGVVRWAGWALAVRRSACLRCVFEDVPRDRVETCATAGVVGSVVGAIGALQASLAIRLLLDDLGAPGTLFHHDALRGTLRETRVARRSDCPLCGPRATIRALEEARYLPACAD